MDLDIFNKHDVCNDSSNIVFSLFNENRSSGKVRPGFTLPSLSKNFPNPPPAAQSIAK